MARKIKSGKAKTWPLEYGEGQGPRPGDHTLPPLKVKGKKAPFDSKGNDNSVPVGPGKKWAKNIDPWTSASKSKAT